MDCAVLGVYPPHLLGLIFENRFLQRFLDSKASDIDWIQIDMLCRSVKIEQPNYLGPFPSEDILNIARGEAAANLASWQSPMEQVINKIVGCSSCFKSGMMTKMGHFIGDYSIIILIIVILFF